MPKKTVTNKQPKRSVKPKAASRKLTTAQYKSFRLQQRIKHPSGKLPGSFTIFKTCLRVLLKDWKLFGGIVFIYLVLNVVFVKGLGSGLPIEEMKQAVKSIFEGAINDVGVGVVLFGAILASTGGVPSDLAAGYQAILVLIVSLALIWVLRQRHANEKITISEAFYKSMYPFIPYLLVIIVVVLQLLPLFLASYLYPVIFYGGIAVTGLEGAIWGVLLFCLAILSFYMVSSSIFALYIVTLPDMRPLRTLRSARELVRFRRWSVMRKILFLPLALFVLGAVVTLPVILFATPIAEWFFFALTMVGLAVTHSYLYTLYRELL